MKNQYVILVRTDLDDLPVMITASRDSAIGEIDNMLKNGFELLYSSFDEYLDLMQLDAGPWISIFIVEYESGKPIKAELITTND